MSFGLLIVALILRVVACAPNCPRRRHVFHRASFLLQHLKLFLGEIAVERDVVLQRIISRNAPSRLHFLSDSDRPSLKLGLAQFLTLESTSFPLDLVVDFDVSWLELNWHRRRPVFVMR